MIGPLLSTSKISPFFVPTRMWPWPRDMARMEGLSSRSSPVESHGHSMCTSIAFHLKEQPIRQAGLLPKGSETVTFGAGRQHRPLDGVGLEASFKAVIPQRHYSVLPSSHKPLQAQERHTSKKEGAALTGL